MHSFRNTLTLDFFVVTCGTCVVAEQRNRRRVRWCDCCGCGCSCGRQWYLFRWGLDDDRCRPRWLYLCGGGATELSWAAYDPRMRRTGSGVRRVAGAAGIRKRCAASNIAVGVTPRDAWPDSAVVCADGSQNPPAGCSGRRGPLMMGAAVAVLVLDLTRRAAQCRRSNGTVRSFQRVAAAALSLKATPLGPTATVNRNGGIMSGCIGT